MRGDTEFEELIAEAYRRMGYSVVENYDIGPDGGDDVPKIVEVGSDLG